MSGTTLGTAWKLVLWNARRFLPRVGWVGGLALYLLFDSLGEERSSSVLDDLAASEAVGRSNGATLVLCLFLAPVLVVGCAGFGRRWRNREADWLAALPVTRAGVTAGAVGGAALALAVAALAGAAADLLGARHDPPPRWKQAVEHPITALLEGDAPTEWSPSGIRLEELAPGSRFSMRPTVAPGSGPAVSLRLWLEDETGATWNVSARIHGRARISLPVPPDALGAPRLRLERTGPGAVLVLPRGGLELHEPTRGSWRAHLALWLESTTAALAWCVLALGLGTWLRPALAAGVCLSLATLPWWIELHRGLAGWPGRALPALWQAAGEGLVPAHRSQASLGALLGTCVVLGLGTALTWFGLGRGRGTA